MKYAGFKKIVIIVVILSCMLSVLGASKIYIDKNGEIFLHNTHI